MLLFVCMGALLTGMCGAAETLLRPARGDIGLASGLNSLRNMSIGELDAEFADYAALGVGWVRTDIYWANVQADGPESHEWSVTDRIVDMAQANGLNVLFVVGTTPRWAREIPEERSGPRDPEDYARFLGEAVRRYAGRGVHGWEIWNEPNIIGGWPPSPDPVSYAKLLTAAYAAIKREDPGAVVLLGGLSPVVSNTPGKFLRATDFLERVYQEGAGGSFDAVAFHPYSYPRLPGDPVGWSGWTIMARAIREIMVEHGDGGKKVWITEYGAPTNESASRVSEEDQADMLRDALSLAGRYEWAGPLFWYSYRDRGTDEDNNEDWFGLVRPDGSRKPAYRVLQSIMNGAG